MNPRGAQFRHYKASPAGPHRMSGNQVAAVLEDRRRDIWIGTLDGGLSRLRFAPAADDDTLGLSQAPPLQVANFRHHAGQPGSLSHNSVTAICEDRRGILWVGTWGGGLNRLDPGSGRFTHFAHQPGVPGSLGDPENEVWSIYEDSRERLWIGTDNGLFRLVRRGKTPCPPASRPLILSPAATAPSPPARCISAFGRSSKKGTVTATGCGSVPATGWYA